MQSKRIVRKRRSALVVWGFGAALVLPLMLWLTFPRFTPPTPRVPTATPQIVRVRAPLDEAIPVDWQAPELNPELEAAVLALTDTLPLSDTADLALPLERVSDTNGWSGLVVSEAVHFRDGPSGAYMSLMVLQQTTSLTVVGQYEGWYQATTSAGAIGWVDQNYVAVGGDQREIPLAAAIPNPEPTLTAQVAVDAANLRTAPNRSSSVIKVLPPTDLTLLARRNDWYNVQTLSGAKGWVAADVLAVEPYIARRVPVLRAAPQALEAVRIARKYIGYPYVWGAEYPSEGFDCSGLVKYVYGKLDVALPHGSIEQWQSGIGTKIIDQNELLPGDIVYFKNTWRRGISHVGIYASDGMVIQAISSGNGVRVVSMYEDYWIPRYVGAIRIFQ